MFTKEIVKFIQRILNPAGLERLLSKLGLSGLPIGQALSYYVANYLFDQYNISIPGGKEILAAYVRNDYQRFINGNPQDIADELNGKKRCINLFGADLCFGEDTFNWKVLAGIGIAGFLAYKFLKT